MRDSFVLTVFSVKTASVLSHSEPWFGAHPSSLERPRAILSTRLTTSREEYDLPVNPHVYGSRELSCANRPYFSFSMNSLMGMLSGICGNWPADLAGRKTISESLDVTGCSECHVCTGEEGISAGRMRLAAVPVMYGILLCSLPFENHRL